MASMSVKRFICPLNAPSRFAQASLFFNMARDLNSNLGYLFKRDFLFGRPHIHHSIISR